MLIAGAMKRLSTLLAAAALVAPVTACVTDGDPYDGETVKSDDGKADASALAVFVDIEFEGTLLTDLELGRQPDDPGPAALHDRPPQRQRARSAASTASCSPTSRRPRSAARRRSRTTRSCRSRGRKTQPGPRHLRRSSCPLDISSAGQSAFTEKYKDDCVDFGAHDVDAGIMWYYYRPHNSGCALAAGDVDRGDRDRVAEPDPDHRQVPRVRQGLGGRHAQRRRDLRQVRGRRDHRRRRHRRLQRVRRVDEAELGAATA